MQIRPRDFVTLGCHTRGDIQVKRAKVDLLRSLYEFFLNENESIDDMITKITNDLASLGNELIMTKK